MKEMSILQFVGFLGTLPLEIEHANHEALERAAKIVEREAKDVLGTYRYGWPQLAQATQEDRARRGYPANEPGLVTGEMRDSIEHTVSSRGEEACIGSDEDKMLWFELGTATQPPRPTLTGALQHKTHDILEEVGRAVVGKLSGTAIP